MVRTSFIIVISFFCDSVFNIFLRQDEDSILFVFMGVVGLLSGGFWAWRRRFLVV